MNQLIKKNVVNAAIVVGSAIAVYLLFFKNKISDQEKNDIFFIASGGLRGGAAPPPDVQADIEKKEIEAKLMIEKYKLQNEFDQYKKNKVDVLMQ